MSLNQLIECLTCGFSESVSYPKMPWEAWPNGCPKCGGKQVDVTVVLDKSGVTKEVKKEGRATVLVQDDGERTLGREANDEGANPSPSDSMSS